MPTLQAVVIYFVEQYDELRDECPFARTERYNGAWLPTRHTDVSAIAYDTEHFTSRSVVAKVWLMITSSPMPASFCATA